MANTDELINEELEIEETTEEENLEEIEEDFDDIDIEIEENLEEEPYEKDNLDTEEDTGEESFIKIPKLSKKTMIFIMIIVVLAAIGSTIYMIIRHKRMTVVKDNIYVNMSSDTSDVFVDWIKNGMDIHWVPTFLVIQDEKCVGTIQGTIGADDFKSELGSVLLFAFERDLPDCTVTNINGETKKLTEVVAGKSLCFIELAWIDCPDCVEQEKVNPYIYLKYNAPNFYTFYMKSELQDVIDYYN